MEVSSTYSSPVTVNGYSCRSCSEVALAERNIDPANPASGPNGGNDPKKTQTDFFSPEARNVERLQQLHEARVGAGSAIANAYGAGEGRAPGKLVNRLA